MKGIVHGPIRSGVVCGRLYGESKGRRVESGSWRDPTRRDAVGALEAGGCGTRCAGPPRREPSATEVAHLAADDKIGGSSVGRDLKYHIPTAPREEI